MGTTTGRFALTLPDPADNVDITKLNADFVTIDNALGLTPCTVGTRPSSPGSGQAIYETDTHNAYVWDTSGAVGVWHHLIPAVVMVTSDFSVISDVVGQQVSDLTLTMAAQTSYALDMFFVYTSATAADAALSFSLPSGCTVLLNGGGADLATVGTSGNLEKAAVTTPALTFGGAGTSAPMTARVTGTVITGSAGGNIVGVLAQVVSTATNTTVKAGSWMRLQRI